MAGRGLFRHPPHPQPRPKHAAAQGSRLYFTTSDGGYDFFPGGTDNGTWVDPFTYDVNLLKPFKGPHTLSTDATRSLSGTANEKVLDALFVSPPLAAQTISGTVAMQMLVRELVSTDNVDRVIVGIRVISEDGSTTRGTLLTPANYGTTSEFLDTGYRNKTAITAGTALTPVTAQLGDKLVIEVGYSNSTAGTTPQASSSIGDDSTLPDLGINETETSGVSWIEFSQPLYFDGDDIVQDSFTRTLSDDIGNADTGQMWTRQGGAGTDYNVNNVLGITTNGSDSYTARVDQTWSTRARVRGDVYISAFPSSESVEIHVHARWQSPQTYYRIDFDWLNPSGTTEIRAFKVVNDAYTQIGSTQTSGVGLSPIDRYKFRVEITDTNPTTLRGKIWDPDGAEPGWEIEVTDSEPYLQNPGFTTLAIYTIAANAPDVSFDNVYINADYFTADAEIVAPAAASVPSRRDIVGDGKWRRAKRIAPQRQRRLAPTLIPEVQSASFTSDAIVLRTISSSFTANAVIKREQTGSLTADATIRRTIAGSLTADAVVLRAQSGSFTANAVVFRTINGSFTADAIIRREATGSFTADADISSRRTTPRSNITGLRIWRPAKRIRPEPQRQLPPTAFFLTQSGSFTGDAIVKREQTGSFTANAVIKREISGSFTADAVVKKQVDGTFTGDAVVLRAQTGSFTGDAVIFRTQVGSITADAVVFRTIAGSLTADAVIVQSVSGSFTANAIVRREATGSLTADAIVLRTTSGTFTADADISARVLVQQGNLTGSRIWRAAKRIAPERQRRLHPTNFSVEQTGSVTADAVVKATISGAFTANAAIRTATSGQITVDAVIFRTQSGSFTADAFIIGPLLAGRRQLPARAIRVRPQQQRKLNPTNFFVTLSGSFTADAVVRRETTSSFAADAVILRTQAGSFTADAIVRAERVGALTADAVLLITASATFSANAVIRATLSGSFAADAVIKREQTFSFSADAVVVRTTTGAFFADAVVFRTITGSLTGDAVLLRTQTGSFTADAVVTFSTTGQFTADAVIFRTQTGSFSADAVVLRSQAGSFTSDAVVLLTRTGTFSADAIIRRGVSGSVTADAVVLRTIAGSITADAVVFRTMSGSFSADAIVVRTTSGSLNADAVLRRTQSGSLTADAVVYREQTGSFTADAFINAIGVFTFSADAVIQAAGTGSFSADAVIGYVGRCVWVSPANHSEITGSPVLVFVMPPSSRNMHFNIHLDRVDTFDSVDLRVVESFRDLTGWEYWNGSSWQPIPQGGVSPSFSGNEARYTVQTPLASGTWFRRVRAGVI